MIPHQAPLANSQSQDQEMKNTWLSLSYHINYKERVYILLSHDIQVAVVYTEP